MFEFKRGTLLDLTGPLRADLWLKPINDAMSFHGIDTKQRASYFLAQLLVESNKLQTLEENLNYTTTEVLAKVYPTHLTTSQAINYLRNPQKLANLVYANRLGNTEPGDGWKYRGRGLIQLTGRANYAEASLALDYDFVGKPEALCEPIWAARSAAWFWQHHNLNKYADNKDVQGLTKVINGGLQAIVQRVAMTAAVLRLC